MKKHIHIKLSSFTAIFLALFLCSCADTDQLYAKKKQLQAKIDNVKNDIARLSPTAAAAGIKTGVGMDNNIDTINTFGGGSQLKDDFKELNKLQAQLADLNREIARDSVATLDTASITSNALDPSNALQTRGGWSPIPCKPSADPSTVKPCRVVCAKPCRMPMH